VILPAWRFPGIQSGERTNDAAKQMVLDLLFMRQFAEGNDARMRLGGWIFCLTEGPSISDRVRHPGIVLRTIRSVWIGERKRDALNRALALPRLG
jgi:hypothetical protein